MALSGLKCWRLWHLPGLAGFATAVCSHCPHGRQGMQNVRCLGRSIRMLKHQPAHSHCSISRKSSVVFIDPLPSVPLFSVSGLSMGIQTRSIHIPSGPVFPTFSVSQNKSHSSYNSRNKCHINKEMLNTSDLCVRLSSKTLTQNRLQPNKISAPVQVGPLSTKSCSYSNVQTTRNFSSVEFTSAAVRAEVIGRHRRSSTQQYAAGSRTLGFLPGQLAPVMTQGPRHYTAGVHRPVSALAVKRPARKKISKTAQEEMEQRDAVVAYAVAEELNLGQLKEALIVQGLYLISPLPIDAQDALHVQAKYLVDGKKREIFFFRDGSAVFWSMTELERKEALKFVRKHDIGRYTPNLILREREEMDLTYIRGATGVSGDTLQLNENQDQEQSTLEKYAFSNALAQSVKLAIWESSLETFVDSIEYVTEELRDGKKISMSRREVLRRTGELFALRHLINLSSDLLDTPDFYWDRAVLEPLYLAVYNHLDISRRTKVMNEKLNHCCELTELLSSHLNDAHHTRLEVMIIVLILVEERAKDQPLFPSAIQSNCTSEMESTVKHQSSAPKIVPVGDRVTNMEVVFEVIHYIERYVDAPLPSDPIPEASVAASSDNS